MSLNPGLVLSPSASLREALEAITKNGRQAVFVADDGGRLVGLVTDGDVRRGLLRGVSLDAGVTDVMNRRPVAGPADLSRDEAIPFMQQRAIRHLPLIDRERRLVDVLFLDELLRPSALPNAAVIMAGGFGRRLGELTRDTPKPLLKVGTYGGRSGRPLLEIMVERLRDAGFRHLCLVVNYMGRMIEAHFGNGTSFGVSIEYMYDDDGQPRGTAGKLADFRGHVDQSFLVMNGDILTKCDFRAMLEFHERHTAAITVGMVPYTVDVPFGVLEIDGERLIGMREKQAPVMINAGIYVLHPWVLEHVRRWEEPRLDMPGLIERMMAPGQNVLAGVVAQPSKVVAFPIREYWLDVGRPDDLEKADRDVAEGLLE